MLDIQAIIEEAKNFDLPSIPGDDDDDLLCPLCGTELQIYLAESKIRVGVLAYAICPSCAEAKYEGYVTRSE